MVFSLWGWTIGKRLDLATEHSRFSRYLRGHLTPPKVWHDLSHPPIECQTPLELRLLVLLLSDLHYSERDALTVEVARATAMLATLGELRGKFSFQDERTEDFIAFVRRMETERAQATTTEIE